MPTAAAGGRRRAALGVEFCDASRLAGAAWSIATRLWISLKEGEERLSSRKGGCIDGAAVTRCIPRPSWPESGVDRQTAAGGERAMGACSQ